MVVWQCHQLLSAFLAIGHLPWVSHLSANGNEIIAGVGLCTNLLAFNFKQRKTSARRSSDKGCATSHCLKWGHLPPNYIVRISQHIRKGERRKEQGSVNPCCPWGLRPKKFQTSVTVPSAPVRVPSQMPLAPNVASIMSVANDKDDNEIILGVVHRSGIFLTAEEN